MLAVSGEYHSLPMRNPGVRERDTSKLADKPDKQAILSSRPIPDSSY